MKSAALLNAAAAWALAGSIAFASEAERPITIGQSISGELMQGDRQQADGSFSDFYVFEGRAGQTVTIEMSSRQLDSYVGLFAEGEKSPLAYNDNAGRSGRDARLNFVLPRTQRYLVAANAASGGETGAYRLSVRETAAVRPTPPKPRDIAPGKPAAGELSERSGRAADGSLYETHRFRAKAGERFHVSLESRQFDSFVSVHRPGEDQDLGFASARGGGAADLSFTAPSAGVFEIRANAATEGEKGRYLLRLERDAPAAPPSPQAIAYADTVRGELAIGDAVGEDARFYDLYRFKGARGDEVTITMRSSMFEPFLSVHAPGEGRSLASAVDDGNGGRDAELTFIVPADGTYEVLANAWRGERGDYVISIERIGRLPGARAENPPIRDGRDPS